MESIDTLCLVILVVFDLVDDIDTVDVLLVAVASLLWEDLNPEVIDFFRGLRTWVLHTRARKMRMPCSRVMMSRAKRALKAPGLVCFTYSEMISNTQGPPMITKRLPRILACSKGVLLFLLFFIALAFDQCETRLAPVTIKQIRLMMISMAIIR